MQGFDDIQRLFTDAALEAACDAYESTASDATKLGAFENYVFELPDNRILRIAHERRRPTEWITAEIEWIHDLAAYGVSAAAPIRSRSGEWVTHLPNGFRATAFHKVIGRRAERADFTDSFLRGWGHMMGRMHVHAVDYDPPSTNRRPEWDDPRLLDTRAPLMASGGGVGNAFRKLAAELDRLPRDRDGFGLIHQDFHAGNFLIAPDETLHVFDFDDAAYAWFASDIAIVCFYGCIRAEEDPVFVERFVRAFARGYTNARPLPAEWARTIPLFLKLREIDLYEIIRTRISPTPDPETWAGAFMRDRRARITKGQPTLALDVDGFVDAFRATRG